LSLKLFMAVGNRLLFAMLRYHEPTGIPENR